MAKALIIPSKPGQDEEGGQEREVEEQTSEEQVLDSLTTYRVWKRSHFLTASYTCEICYRRFNVGDYVRCLPCKHRYHFYCIDNWLKWVGAYCPVDRIKLIAEEDEDAGEEEKPFDDGKEPGTTENYVELIEEAANALKCMQLKKGEKSKVTTGLPPVNEVDNWFSHTYNLHDLLVTDIRNKAKRPVTDPSEMYIYVQEAGKNASKAITADANEKEAREWLTSKYCKTDVTQEQNQTKDVTRKDNQRRENKEASRRRKKVGIRDKDVQFNEESNIEYKSLNITESLEDYFKKVSRYKRKLGKLSQTTFGRGSAFVPTMGTDHQFHYQNGSEKGTRLFDGFARAEDKKSPDTIWILKRRPAFGVSRYSRH